METSTNNPMPRVNLGVLVLNAAALLAFACAPVAQEYPLAVIGILAFLFVQAFLPACRIDFRVPLCPNNIAQGFYWVQLVLVTVLIGYFGFSQGTLPYLPGMDAINLAIFVHVVGYLSFSVAYQWFSAPSSPARADATPRNATGAGYLIVPFAIVGLVGLYLSFGGVGGFVDYVASPLQHKLRAEEPTTPEGAAGNFLKHFLGFGLVLAWSWWIGSGSRSKAATVGVTAGTALLLLVANFSYNRGTMFGPLLALAAAFSAHVWRIPFKAVALAGVLAISAAFAIGTYRSSRGDISELSSASMEDGFDADRFVEFVQVYASAPQLPAFMIEHLDHEQKFYFGGTLVPSLLYPVPVLGKPYREHSGTVLFNGIIYGDPDNLDQIIPLDCELYVNFHLPGVLFGNALLGWFLSRLHGKFLSAASPVESYSWLMLALWTVFPGSLPVISQIYVYSFWPIYVYFAFKWTWGWRPRTGVESLIAERGFAS